MAHSTADIIKAQDEYLRAARAMLAIYAGKVAAIENSYRAVTMGTAAEQALQDEQPQPRRTIKELAAKMAGNGQ